MKNSQFKSSLWITKDLWYGSLFNE